MRRLGVHLEHTGSELMWVRNSPAFYKIKISGNVSVDPLSRRWIKLKRRFCKVEEVGLRFLGTRVKELLEVRALRGELSRQIQ